MLTEGVVFQLGRTRFQVKLIDDKRKSMKEEPKEEKKNDDIPTGTFSPEFVAQLKKTVYVVLRIWCA